MKKILTLSLLFGICGWAAAQCTTTNATSCICADGSQDCDLLPNVKLSYDLLSDPAENPETPQLLRVSVGTPNLGHGPLTVKGTTTFVCGLDTIVNGTLQGFTCPNGATPRQLVKQIIYHKSGNTMTSYERWAGSMTYHPTHGHSHFDDWGVYTLRNDNGDPNPLNWPIIGQGAKLGFCLMDYGSCSDYPGYCRDDNNNTVLNNNPNQGLGGGQYSCAPTNQGISAGHIDIYYQYLDGMFITIPAGVCNGPYKIVVQVDPHNVLLEENDADNVMVADVTLTQQSGSAAGYTITANGPLTTCNPNALQLSVPQVGTSYLWSNGATTASITPPQSGAYTCEITTICGTVTTPAVQVTVNPAAVPQATDATICVGQTATLSATASGTAKWYPSATGGSLLFSGSNFTTPVLNATTSYFVENETSIPGLSGNVGPTTVQSTSNSSVVGALIFDATEAFNLKTVEVTASTAGNRTIELRNSAGAVLQSATINIPVGTSTVTLNFPVPIGTNHQLGVTGTTPPGLDRSNQGVVYPYTFGNVVSITNSNYGTNAYYYFYNWSIDQDPAICNSVREEVLVTVNTCSGNEELNQNISRVVVTPNPNNGNFVINLETSEMHNIQYQVFDATGKQLTSKDLGAVNGTRTENVSIENLSNGIYMLQIVSDGKITTRKFTVAK